jgi:HSP20 family protein
MSTQSNPFEEMKRLFERMTQQFDEASRMWETEGPSGRWDSVFEPMAADLLERDDEFVVTVDLPGFESDDVDIQVENRTLRIRAEQEEEKEEEQEQYLRRERRHESALRSIQLPEAVNAEDVKAKIKHGVLTISLPKLKGEEAHTIKVK